jgi:protein-S-isoprenylcysteine O-methyltransferase Ste14
LEFVFARNPLFFTVLVIGALAWVVMEVVMQARQLTRWRPTVRAQIQRHDKGSRLLLEVLIRLGILLCLFVALTVPATAITGAREFFFWLGMLLSYAGLTLRFYSIRVLGAYFTPNVQVAPEQRIIQAGPYRLIRHPAYTGLLLILLGFGLACTNWLALLVLMVCALVGLGYRIHVEEQVLQEALGQPYEEYIRRTKRLVPFVL